MKHIIILTLFGTLFSCSLKRTLTINPNTIRRIEIYQGYPGNKIQMKEGFEKEFITDLNKSKDVGPTKYMKTHRILIHYTHKKTDTIYTNGNIHNFKNWYKSDENLIEKYSIKQILNDTTAGQIATIDKLKKLMSEKKYNEVILLFSKKQQDNITEIKKEPEMFSYWCSAWTLDEAKYERYKKSIIAGKGIFVFEDNEWKIDEK